MSRWLLAAVVLGCWGCAFSLDGPDPQRPRNRVPRCDTSKGLVGLDGVMATAFGVTTLAVAAEGEPAAALIPLGIGALYLGGAVAGNRAVDACRKALEDYDQSYDGERYAITDDDEDDDKPVIPRGQPAGQASQPQRFPQQPPPYQTPYPPAGYPNAPASGYPPPTPAQPFPAQPQPPVVQPTQPPPPPQPAQQPPRQQRPAPAAAADDGDWSDFWREVP